MANLLADIETLVHNQQSIAFLAAFLGGLVSAASPCVLAAIPLIIGFVGGYSGGDAKKAACYSFVFVLGLSTTFTLLGAAASAAGQFLGFLGRWLYLGFGVIAVLMGLHLLGVLSVPLPFEKTRVIRTKGLLGAFILGLLTGAISSPCATPVLAVILAYVTAEGDILYGSSLLFVYAIAHCTLIFLCGLSVGLAESIISSRGLRNFSLYAKKLSGVMLIAVGSYFGVTSI